MQKEYYTNLEENTYTVGFFKRALKTPNIAITGLSQVGKSTLLENILKFDSKKPKASTLPTQNYTQEEVLLVDKKIVVQDFGGHKVYRNLWHEKLPKAQVLIYVIDGSKHHELFYDSDYVKEDIKEFAMLREDLIKKKLKIPVLVLVNKIDILIDAGVSKDKLVSLYRDVAENFKLKDIKGNVIGISATKIYNIREVAKYLMFVTFKEKLEETTYVEGVYIINHAGETLLAVGNIGSTPMMQIPVLLSVANSVLSKITDSNHYQVQDLENKTYIFKTYKKVQGIMIINKVEKDLEDCVNRFNEILEKFQMYNVDNSEVAHNLSNDIGMIEEIQNLISLIRFS